MSCDKGVCDFWIEYDDDDGLYEYCKLHRQKHPNCAGCRDRQVDAVEEFVPLFI